jgi:hypothetical protein
MKLLIARLLMRIRGPIDVQVVTKGDNFIEGEPVLMRCHRRYVTVWTLWHDRRFDALGNKVPYIHLTIHRIPWRRIDEVYQQIGGEDD